MKQVNRTGDISRGLRTVAAALAAPIIALALASKAAANTEPLQVVGEGTLRWLGLKIYDARLLAAAPLEPTRIFDQAFALELTYARGFYGNLIAERSLEEIKKQGLGTPRQHEQWLALMKQTFPDVTANDRLRGVHRPGVGAEFYLNGKRVQLIADPEFSKAFFSIWLSPQTTEPGLRRSLLGSSRGL